MELGARVVQPAAPSEVLINNGRARIRGGSLQ